MPSTPRFRMLGLAPLAVMALGLSACHKDDAATGAVTSGATSGASAVAAVPAPAGKQWADVVAKTADGGMVMGNPAAPIKLVEYGSLSCPHCAHLAQEAMPTLTAKYVNTGKVSYEFHSFAIHPMDVPLTVLVRCADPAAYFGLVDQLYLNYDPMMAKFEANIKAVQATQQLPAAQRWIAMSDAAGYTEFFAARGVPTAKAHACLADLASAQSVANEADAISAKNIDSTPTILVNGTKYVAPSWAQLETTLQNAGAR